MDKFGLTTMLLIILSAGSVLAAVSREQVDLPVDLAFDDLADAWWELSGERPPVFQE